MSIQQAVNQALSTAGIAARLSPEYETKQQTYALEQEKKKLIAEQKTLAEETKGDLEKRIVTSSELGIPSKLAATAEKLAYLGQGSPKLAAEALKQSKIHSAVARGIQTGKLRVKPMNAQEFLLERQAQANKQAMGQTEAKKAQRRNFMEYLRKQPIAGGGFVGQLPPKAQKQIASQYSKQERKQLMDEEDKR